MDKRTFLKQMTLTSLGLPLALESMTGHAAPSTAGHTAPGTPASPRPTATQDLATRLAPYRGIPADDLAADEEFWNQVRAGYKLKPDYINLENGYYNIQPEEILQAFMRHVNEVNYEGSYYMRTVQFERKRAIAGRLAQLAGCQPDELIITRNTTESLDMIIGGYPWKQGDEAIMAFRTSERSEGWERALASGKGEVRGRCRSCSGKYKTATASSSKQSPSPITPKPTRRS
jgi:hypothetical protein